MKKPVINIIPMVKYVVVEKKEKETTLTSGIILTSVDKDKAGSAEHGTIVAVNPKDSEFDVGTKIIFKGWSGTEVKDQDGKKLFLVESENIMAVTYER